MPSSQDLNSSSQRTSSVAASSFLLKDSPPALIAASGVPPKGRTYSARYATQPGGIRIDDVVLGMKYASVAITDDAPGTLKNVGKSNPWHVQALTVITGSEEEAHRPLTHILKKTFDLNADVLINISGWKAGYALDTQGYIAHNDTTIVLAYRCTTSFKDWMTNLTTTSSEWEPEIDVKLGHSGWCSCLDGLCSKKPRVHTGFYNNFIAALPLVQKHVDPLLAPDQPPRKLYVVGHSLGAGIATMAACYFLLEHDWVNLPHKISVVTAGGPRAVKSQMKDLINDKMDQLRPMDKAVICRLVRDKDVVPSVPPKFLGFDHLEKLVYITKEGEVLINPVLSDDYVVTTNEMEEMEAKVNGENDESSSLVLDDAEEEDEEKKKALTNYERKMKMIPRPLRDHCPDYYLVPLIKLFEREKDVSWGTGDDDRDGMNGQETPEQTVNVTSKGQEQEEEEAGEDQVFSC